MTIENAGDLVYAALAWYTRGKTFKQTLQDRPLLAILERNKKSFPSGKDYLYSQVQGAWMDAATPIDGAGTFFAGYTTDDTLDFCQAANILQTRVSWYEVHAGLVLNWTELKVDGITVNDKQVTSDHANELTRLTAILENRLEDFAESWARQFNLMCWKDGSQDAKQVPGILNFLTDTPAVGTTANLNRATYSWWRHRAAVGASKITASAENSTLTKKLRSEVRQLRRYGGRPSVILCGSGFIEALELEVHAKGEYTTTGFVNKGTNDIGMADISLVGLGTFQYDPTLDDLGYSKRCYVFDPKKLKLRPMEGEENKVLKPERPYDQLVFLKSMTWTGAMECTQLNANGVYEVA